MFSISLSKCIQYKAQSCTLKHSKGIHWKATNNQSFPPLTISGMCLLFIFHTLTCFTWSTCFNTHSIATNSWHAKLSEKTTVFCLPYEAFLLNALSAFWVVHFKLHRVLNCFCQPSGPKALKLDLHIISGGNTYLDIVLNFTCRSGITCVIQCIRANHTFVPGHLATLGVFHKHFNTCFK